MMVRAACRKWIIRAGVLTFYTLSGRSGRVGQSSLFQQAAVMRFRGGIYFVSPLPSYPSNPRHPRSSPQLFRLPFSRNFPEFPVTDIPDFGLQTSDVQLRV